jgi:hypothetical protein
VSNARKAARGRALKAFRRLFKSFRHDEWETKLGCLLKAVEAQNRGKWSGIDRQYIPYASTWLNDHAWADEEASAQPPPDASPACEPDDLVEFDSSGNMWKKGRRIYS